MKYVSKLVHGMSYNSGALPAARVLGQPVYARNALWQHVNTYAACCGQMYEQELV